MTNPEMESGECRWMGRPDLHVYCRGTRVGGRYDARVRQYKLWWPGRPAAWGSSPWNDGGWESWPAVAARIEEIMQQEPRP
jgi:hypothetical protein